MKRCNWGAITRKGEQKRRGEREPAISAVRAVLPPSPDMCYLASNEHRSFRRGLAQIYPKILPVRNTRVDQMFETHDEFKVSYKVCLQRFLLRKSPAGLGSFNLETGPA